MTEPSEKPVATAFVDTNVLVRHLTGDPPREAATAGRLLASPLELLLTDVVWAEVGYVLESYYEASRAVVATALRAVVAHPTIRVVDADLLLRAVEVYETDRLDLTDAYLVASAERTGVGAVASFDRSFDRIASLERVTAAGPGTSGPFRS